MRCDTILIASNESPLTFQSLLGFLMRCDSQTTPAKHGRQVSIPAGFSDALRQNRAPALSCLLSFQSLLGFLMRCDLMNLWGSRTTKKKFQSLLGFLMRCDNIFNCVAEPASLFQSLLGFLMRCDLRPHQSYPCAWFQSLLGFLMRCDQMNAAKINIAMIVSIPAGFSDALRLKARDAMLVLYTFQSLLGFLMRCDACQVLVVLESIIVSIPAGFSDALRRVLDVGHLAAQQGFNPCWVF